MAIVGSVCMDMITIDVTGTDVSPGDEVVLIGRQDQDEITAREIAASIGSIPWEVMCRLAAGWRGNSVTEYFSILNSHSAFLSSNLASHSSIWVLLLFSTG
jgi:hypothetical protein